MFSPLLLATVLWVASSSLILQNRHLLESTQLGKGGARGHVQVCPLLTPCSANLKKAMLLPGPGKISAMDSDFFSEISDSWGFFSEISGHSQAMPPRNDSSYLLPIPPLQVTME